MAFPTVAAFAETLQASNATAHAGITVPAHNTGDMLMLVSGTDGDNILSSVSTLNGAAWTVVFTTDVTQNAVSSHMAFVRATSNQATPTTVTATFTQSEVGTHQVYRLTGVHATSAPEGGFGTLTSLAYDPPSLTASWGSDDNLWFAGASVDDSSQTTNITSIPANYANGQIRNMAVNGGICHVTARRELAAATENPGTGDIDTSEQWTSFTIVVRGAVAAAPASPRAARPPTRFGALLQL